MSSILDINSGSSDSEDDQDYVPPTAALSDESDEEVSEEEHETSPKKIKLDVKEEKEPSIDKKCADNIWKDFLKGVDSSPYNVGQRKAISAGLNVSHQSVSDSSDVSSSQDKTTELRKSTCEMTIPEKEIISESSMKDETLSDNISKDKKENTSDKIVPIKNDVSIEGKDNSCKTKPEKAHVEINVAKKTGIGGILGAIANKDKKMTVLEKSLLDWKSFKQQEGIDKDLEIYNKGKNGYVERKRFLERSDLRMFETEKSARLSGRKK